MSHNSSADKCMSGIYQDTDGLLCKRIFYPRFLCKQELLNDIKNDTIEHCRKLFNSNDVESRMLAESIIMNITGASLANHIGCSVVPKTQ